MAEREYETDETLPEFALKELGKDFKLSFVFADPENRNVLPGVGVVGEADILLLSVRRRNLPGEQLDLFRKHIEAGKPLVGIRTASHPFHQNKSGPPEGLDEWRDFDPVVLGGSYHGHHGNRMTSFARVEASGVGHPILRGVSERQFQTYGSLYEVRPLAESTTVLMSGHVREVSEREPVAWTNEGPAGNRIFYTSLGHPYDFTITNFRTMLRNAVYWAADVPELDKDELLRLLKPLHDDCFLMGLEQEFDRAEALSTPELRQAATGKILARFEKRRGRLSQ